MISLPGKLCKQLPTRQGLLGWSCSALLLLTTVSMPQGSGLPWLGLCRTLPPLPMLHPLPIGIQPNAKLASVFFSLLLETAVTFFAILHHPGLPCLLSEILGYLTIERSDKRSSFGPMPSQWASILKRELQAVALGLKKSS